MTLLTPSIYNRNYQRDVEGISPESPSTFQRIILAALPVLSFYTPVQQVLSLSMDGMRTISSLALLKKSYEDGSWRNGSVALLQGAVAVAAIAGTYFAHPVGLAIINTYELLQSLIAGNFSHVLIQTVYLSMFLANSVELAILLLSLQILTDIAKIVEAKMSIESVGHLLVILIRIGLLALNINTFLLRKESKTTFISEQAEKLFEESGKQNKDKVALFIYAKSDYNGALAVDGAAVLELKHLAKEYQLRKAVVTSPQEFYSAIETTNQSLKSHQSFDLLVISAHGSKYGFQLGFGWNGSMLISDLYVSFFNYIKKAVVLSSCSTGKEGGIADFLAYFIPDRKVYAPKEEAYGRTCFPFYDNAYCSRVTYNNQTEAAEAHFYSNRDITRVYAY